MAAREGMASESLSGPWVSLGHSWTCLWGKEEREGTLLEAPPEKPFLLAVAQGLPFALQPFPSSGTTVLSPDEGEPKTMLEEKI